MNDGFGNDFPDGFPGEKVFIYQPSPVDLQTPNYIKSLMGFTTSAKSIPSNDTDPLTDEFLMSGSLVDLIVFDKSIDPCVMDWLLSCICFSPKFEVIDATYNGLWAITRLKNLVYIEVHWFLSLLTVYCFFNVYFIYKPNILNISSTVWQKAVLEISCTFQFLF